MYEALSSFVNESSQNAVYGEQLEMTMHGDVGGGVGEDLKDAGDSERWRAYSTVLERFIDFGAAKRLVSSLTRS